MAKAMTDGSIVKTLALFSLPLVLSGLLQQLYSWADAFIVGNVEGELQLAAIGATGSVAGLVINMITGFAVGVSILAAHLYGGGNTEQIKGTLSTFVVVLGSLFLCVGILGIFLTGPILRLLSTPVEIYRFACGYLRVIFIGVPFLAVYNIYAAVLRGMGDSKTSFWAIVVSALTNILLDILLVAFFHLGVVGAAVATVVSQAIMAIFIVLYTWRKYPLMTPSFGKDMVDRGIFLRGLRLSLPTAVQSSVHSVGNLILQNFMNGFGAQTVAAITTAYRIDSIIMLPMMNLGSGISTIVAQNIGAGNRKRAKEGLYAGTAMIACVSIALSFMVIPTSGALISIFGVSADAVVIGRRFFRLIALFYLPFGIATAIKGFLEGSGDVMWSGIISMVALGIRIALSYGLAPHYGNDVIALAEAISWIALLLMCVSRFLWIDKRTRFS